MREQPSSQPPKALSCESFPRARWPLSCAPAWLGNDRRRWCTLNTVRAMWLWHVLVSHVDTVLTVLVLHTLQHRVLLCELGHFLAQAVLRVSTGMQLNAKEMLGERDTVDRQGRPQKPFFHSAELDTAPDAEAKRSTHTQSCESIQLDPALSSLISSRSGSRHPDRVAALAPLFFRALSAAFHWRYASGSMSSCGYLARPCCGYLISLRKQGDSAVCGCGWRNLSFWQKAYTDL